jgi:hypothetical protein
MPQIETEKVDTLRDATEALRAWRVKADPRGPEAQALLAAARVRRILRPRRVR